MTSVTMNRAQSFQDFSKYDRIIGRDRVTAKWSDAKALIVTLRVTCLSFEEAANKSSGPKSFVLFSYALTLNIIDEHSKPSKCTRNSGSTSGL